MIPKLAFLVLAVSALQYGIGLPAFAGCIGEPVISSNDDAETNEVIQLGKTLPLDGQQILYDATIVNGNGIEVTAKGQTVIVETHGLAPKVSLHEFQLDRNVDDLTAFELSRNGQYLLVADQQSITVRSMRTWETVFQTDKRPTAPMALSPDGTRIGIVEGTQAGQVIVVHDFRKEDVTTKRFPLEGMNNPIVLIKLFQSPEFVLAASSNRFWVGNLETEKAVFKSELDHPQLDIPVTPPELEKMEDLIFYGIHDLAVSANGRFAAVVEGVWLHVFDLVEGERKFVEQAHFYIGRQPISAIYCGEPFLAGQAKSVVFSADSQQITTIGDQRIINWDIANAHKIKEVPPAAEQANEVAESIFGTPPRMWAGCDLRMNGRTAFAVRAKQLFTFDLATGTLGRLSKGHSLNQIGSIEFSDDGQTLFSRDITGGGCAWNLQLEPRLLEPDAALETEINTVFEEKQRAPFSAKFRKGVIEILDTDGKEVKRINSSMPLYSISVSPDGKLLTGSAGRHYGLTVFDVETEKMLWSEGYFYRQPAKNRGAGMVRFSHDSSLVGELKNGALNLRRVSSAEVIGMIEAPYGTVNCFAISPDNQQIAIGTTHHGIQIHPLAATKEPAERFSIRSWGNSTGYYDRLIATESQPTIFAISKDGNRIAVPSEQPQIVDLYDSSNGEKIKSIETGLNATVWSIALNPDCTRLALAGRKREWIKGQAEYSDYIQLWNLSDSTLVTGIIAGSASNKHVAFSPDGRELFATDSEFVKRFDTTTGKQLSTPEAPPRKRKLRNRSYNTICFSESGSKVLVGEWRAGYEIRDTKSNTVVKERGDRSTSVYSPTLSHSGEWVAERTIERGLKEPAKLVIRNIETDEVVRTIAHECLANSRYLSFSPDDKLILVGGQVGSNLFDVESGNCVVTLVGSTGESVFTPDGSSILTCVQEGIAIWDISCLTAGLK